MSQKITSSHLNATRKNDCQDLLHEIVIYLYDMKQERVAQMIEKKQLSFFIARMMVQQYQSCTSPFYKKYKKHRNSLPLSNSIVEVDNKHIIKKKKEDEEKLEWINKNLKEIEWFAAESFKIYYKDKHSFSSMSKATQISKHTLYKAIRKATDYLKEKLCQKE